MTRVVFVGPWSPWWQVETNEPSTLVHLLAKSKMYITSLLGRRTSCCMRLGAFRMLTLPGNLILQRSKPGCHEANEREKKVRTCSLSSASFPSRPDRPQASENAAGRAMTLEEVAFRRIACADRVGCTCWRRGTVQGVRRSTTKARDRPPTHSLAGGSKHARHHDDSNLLGADRRARLR